MAEALDQVKRRFGRDAVILHTRTVRLGGVMGVGGRTLVEVTAAPVSQTFDLHKPTTRRKVAAKSGRWVRGPGSADQDMTNAATISLEQAAPQLLEELSSLKALVHRLASRARQADASSLSEPLADAFVELIQRQVGEEIAGQLVERVRSDSGATSGHSRAEIQEQLARYVESMLPEAGPIQLVGAPGPTVIALVGPTGVGKTTTIAKLAANFSLREARKVGLITVDTYRIAAVEQLRTFADIVGVPLEVVMKPDQLREAMDRMRECDLILIDTAGRSPADAPRLRELKAFLDVAAPHEVHLVLSTTCAQSVLVDTVERFRVLNVNRVIFTKLDEAIGFGSILTCLTRAKAQLSYVTTGQDVPDDIQVGRSRTLAHLIIKGTRLSAG
jgi:flagellar biosynthesis protein FlhF